MTKDIKQLMDETAGNHPLPAFDADAALKRGHGALSRRRLAVGGLTTGVVAVVAAAMVALPGLMGPARSDDPADPGPGVDAAESPGAEALPELDPDLYYTWAFSEYQAALSEWVEIVPEYDESTAKYENALKGVFDDRFGGYDGDAKFGSLGVKLMSREGADSGEGTAAIADEQTVYRFSSGVVNGQTDDGLVQWGKGKGAYEGLNVDVHAPGDFTLGTDGPVAFDALQGDRGVYDLAHCEDYVDGIQAGQTRDVEVTCEEKTTAKNERLIEITEVAAKGTEYEMTYRTVVLYRVDGSAVVAADSAGEPNQELTFGFDDLTAMATALPLETVL